MFLSSCSILKKTKTKEEKPQRLWPMAIKKLEKQTRENYFDFDQLQLKFTAKLKLPDTKYSLKGIIRIKKDSVMWLYISHASNIPVAKILLKPDTVIFQDRINKKYYKGNYSFVLRLFRLDFDYYSLQSLITNRLFTYPDKEDIHALKKNDYKSVLDSNMFCLTSLKERKIRRQLRKNENPEIILHKIHIKPDEYKVNDIYIHEYNLERELSVNYYNFVEHEGMFFPENTDIKVLKQGKKTEILIDFYKISTDKDLNFSFSIPDKYERIKY